MCCPVHGSGDLSVSRQSRAWPANFCSVWFDYVGWLSRVLGIQVCRQAGIEVICTWLPVLSIVARVSHSYKSGAHRWRWPTQAQLRWRDVNSSKHRCPGQEVILIVIVPLSRRERWNTGFLAAVCWTSLFCYFKNNISHSIQYYYYYYYYYYYDY